MSRAANLAHNRIETREAHNGFKMYIGKSDNIRAFIFAALWATWRFDFLVQRAMLIQHKDDNHGNDDDSLPKSRLARVVSFKSVPVFGKK